MYTACKCADHKVLLHSTPSVIVRDDRNRGERDEGELLRVACGGIALLEDTRGESDLSSGN